MLIRWQSTIVDQRGNIVPGAVLTIRRESDQAIVPVFRDRDGLDPYPTGAVIADQNGFAFFYVSPGLYRFTSAQPAIDWRDVNLFAPSVSLGGTTFGSVADGLAATTDGTYFSVAPSSYGGGLIDLYRNDLGAATYIGSYPSVEAVNAAMASAAMAFRAMPGGSYWPLEFRVSDKSGEPLIWTDASVGVARMLTDLMPGLPTLDAWRQWSAYNQHGMPVLGVTRSGAGFIGGGPDLDAEFKFKASMGDGTRAFGQRWDGTWDWGTGVTGKSYCWTEGAVGSRQIWIYANKTRMQLTVTGDNFAPFISGGVVSYLHDDGAGNIIERTLPVDMSGGYSPSVTDIAFGLATGQSLSLGAESLPWTTTPPAPQFIQSYNFGVRLPQSTNPLTEADIERTIPAVSNVSECPVMQAATHSLPQMAAGTGFLIAALGSGGRSIDELGPGSQMYTNQMMALERGVELQTLAGRTFWVPWIYWNQGQRDRNAAPGVYYGKLEALRNSYQADIEARIPGHGTVPMVTDQISNWTAQNSATSNVPLEQLQIALDQPDLFICAGPEYEFETNSVGIHLLDGYEYARDGRMGATPLAKAAKREHWFPTHMTGAARVDDVVTLTFHTPDGALVLDTTLVTDPGNYGLRWIDAGDGNAVAISSVTVNGDNTVTVQLDAIPTGTGQKIGYADIGTIGERGGPTTGPRGCLRGTPTEFINGEPVYRWACHQQIAVTA